ncbi:MAG: cache domain-containing protein [Polyangiales bacterium]
MHWGMRRWAPLAAFFALGCQDRAAIEQAAVQLRSVDHPRIEELIQQDIENHQAGVVKAAAKLARGFSVEDPRKRERQMRSALRILQQPKKGIDEFVASPMSFLAVVDAKGVVLARDREPDRMKGQDYAARFEVVREALAGNAATGLGEFFAEDPEAPSSWSILFAAPAVRGGEVLGAVVAGIPLWRLAQRLSRQLRVEQAQRTPPWVYLYKGDRVFHWDTPPQIDALIPPAEQRAKVLSASPSGYTDKALLQGDPEVYGVFPLALLGPDLGTIIFRTPNPTPPN